MAKRGNDTFSPSGFNGGDPNPRKSNAYADSDPVSPDVYDYTTWSGDGGREGMHHSDVDPNSAYSKTFLSQNNVIDSNDPDYAGKSSNVWERTSVDVSKSDRGKEY